MKRFLATRAAALALAIRWCWAVGKPVMLIFGVVAALGVWPWWGAWARGAEESAGQLPRHRRLAPGVMKEAQPAPEAEETFTRGDVVELLAVKPELEYAKNVVFRRDIWNLQFRFKPVRMIYVDLPASPEKAQRKLIWYMVYNVTNTGQAMHPTEVADGTYEIRPMSTPVEFIPRFVLESPEYQKYYLDRVIPVAFAAIRMREDPSRQFISSADVVKIEPDESVWGIATWEDVDPRIDRFSIYVGGLTNAYEWEEGPYKPGQAIASGRRLRRKWLKINFWRPGDEYYPHEREIRYGLPDQVDYEWVYR